MDGAAGPILLKDMSPQILSKQVQIVVLMLAGAGIQLSKKVQPLFSRALMVPAISNLLPLFVWASLVNAPTEYPQIRAVSEQILSTFGKVVTLQWVISKYSDYEEWVIACFLLLTHSGLLNPEHFFGDPSYSQHLRYFEDCLLLNLFTRFMKQRKLQMHDSKNAMSRQLTDRSTDGCVVQDHGKRR